MIEAFGPTLYTAQGPVVSFFGFPYPTRMAMAKLADDSVWIWSPVALTDEIKNFVTALGPVRHIVSPNKIHHLFLAEWARQWPEAKLYAPPGLARRRPQLQFDKALGDEPEAVWADEIDQVIFRGSLFMEEVVFFHRASRTAIFCDLIQRHPKYRMSGWKGLLMRIDGLVGEHGGTPREWRTSFLRRAKARAALDKVLGWNPEQLVIAHGDCARSGAREIIAAALRWI